MDKLYIMWMSNPSCNKLKATERERNKSYQLHIVSFIIYGDILLSLMWKSWMKNIQKYITQNREIVTINVEIMTNLLTVENTPFLYSY